MVYACIWEDSGAEALKADIADSRCGSILAGKATGVMRGVRNQDAPLVTSMLEMVDLLKWKPRRRNLCLQMCQDGAWWSWPGVLCKVNVHWCVQQR